MSFISHITLGTNNKAKSAVFYDAVLGVLGFTRLPKPPEKPLAYERMDNYPPFKFIHLMMAGLQHGAMVHTSHLLLKTENKYTNSISRH